MVHERLIRMCWAALAAAGLGACDGASPTEGTEAPEVVPEVAPEVVPVPPASPHSERGGIGLLFGVEGERTVSAQAVTPVDIRRSLVVTEKSILARFGGRRIFTKLHADNGGTGFTPDQLFRQLWDTQNPAPGQPDLPGMPHCSDNANTLNGFPYACRTNEGVQALPVSPINLDSYQAVGLYNRFDLAPADGANCGEYRIVLAKFPFATLSRNFIILEAVLPNPTPNLGLEGCRPVADFWSNLTADADPVSRANKLESFYFTGLPGFPAVVHMSHYGFNSKSEGQVRTNQFIQPGTVPPIQPWLLHEFKLLRDCTTTCTLKWVPVTVKVNPFGDLFNPANPTAKASSFRSHFVTQVERLANPDINRFTLEVPDPFNTGQSDSQTAGAVDDYLARFGPGPSAFHTAIQGELTRIGSPLTPQQVVSRALTQSCAGCHQRSNGAAIGGGLTWPASAGFVHSTESDDPADTTRFDISPALKNVFLPFRKGVLESFLLTPPLDSKFVSMSPIPVTLAPGEPFTVSITYRNTGTTAWSRLNNTHLYPKAGTQWFGVPLEPMATGVVVHKGGEVTFTSTFTAPGTPGVYIFQRTLGRPPGPPSVEFGEPTPVVHLVVM